MLSFVLILLLVAFVTTLLLDYYGDRRETPWFVALVCFISWLFPFSIVVVVPLDLASTEYTRYVYSYTDSVSNPAIFLSTTLILLSISNI